MKLSASLSLTPKGVDEALNRVHKISARQRSVLILLGTPQTVEHVIGRRESLFNHDEILETIIELVDGGFVSVDGEPAARPVLSASGEIIQIANDIILSEAKFLLVDFCVDSFGTQSQKFVDQIGACKNERNLQLCLKNIYVVTESQSPDRLPALMRVITEINETAS
jgi:hypothetical protein